jgi:hypothetical protein
MSVFCMDGDFSITLLLSILLEYAEIEPDTNPFLIKDGIKIIM